MAPPLPSPNGDILFAFLSIVLEGTPYIVLGTLISGFIDAYLPSNLMERLLPRRAFPAVFVSGLLGAIFPVCECAIVPVIRRLVKKGLPVSCAVTYMLSAPIINPIVVVSTLSAFKEPTGQIAPLMTSSRLLIAYAITVIIGLIVTRLPIGRVLRARVLAEGNDHMHTHARGSHDERVTRALRTSMHDFLDTAMYFVVGVLITSVFNTRLMIRPDFQGVVSSLSQNDWLAIPGLMLLAMLLSLCSTTDAFIAANMQAFSLASKLGFLVFGPMFDLKLMFMYSSVFKKRFVLALGVSLFVLVGGFCGLWAFGAPRFFVR
ncbi:MAG: permease [Verrucomicrobiales bacterium]